MTKNRSFNPANRWDFFCAVIEKIVIEAKGKYNYLYTFGGLYSEKVMSFLDCIPKK